MKTLNCLALVCLVALVCVFVFGKNNYFELRELKDKLELQLSENQELKERNEELLRKVVVFKGSDQAVEAIARSEHGLIKEGEVFYQIVELQEAEVDSY